MQSLKSRLAGLFLMAGGAAFTPLGHADTVHFVDGSSLACRVVDRGASETRVRIHKVEGLFRNDAIVRIEPNRLNGTQEPEEARASLDRLKYGIGVYQRTGISLSLREEVEAFLADLSADDPDVVKRSVASLKKLHQAHDLYAHLTLLAEQAKGTLAWRLLDLLYELDAPRTRLLLEKAVYDRDTEKRAHALEVLARYKKKADLPLLVRGALDFRPEVRISAAKALGIVGDRCATPALLLGFNAGDERVRNASVDALQLLWAQPGEPLPYITPSEWSAFWAAQERYYDVPFVLAELEPLVTKKVELSQPKLPH